MLAADKGGSLHLPGYEAVPVQYGPSNKMLMRASINGHAATLFIDTGAGLSVLEARRARPLGVAPLGPKSPYGEFTYLNGQPFRVGFVNSLKAGSMDFGNGPIALFDSNSNNQLSSRTASGSVDGVFGADILTRYKAVINCRTKYIFFKVDSSKPMQMARFASSQKFVRVPMREESNRAFTVPCSINGRSSRLLVDTGAFITTFDQAAAKSLGVPLESTKASGSFADGIARPISLGVFKQLKIGEFRVPPQKVGAAVLPGFAVQHGSAHVDGILGMELLAINHAIIDFDSMSLFLK
jgi:predicted aspartyl protease